MIVLFHPQIGFGFCKGDDNFGGCRRKELDDFTKSLGKQMNLVLKRMEMTERVRSKLRDKRRQDALMEEDRLSQKKQLEFERIEKNREWRQKKLLGGVDDRLRQILGDTPLPEGRCLEWLVRAELLCSYCQR